MSEETKKKLWLLWIIAGAVPGVVIWIALVSMGIAGEFAGIVVGFGAIAFYRWSGASMDYLKMVVGSVCLLVVAWLTNHMAYSLDIYNKFSEGWYGAAGDKFTFFDSVKTVWESFVLQNLEGMRKFYIEAGIQGTLFTLLFWIALFVYYKKMDVLEKAE